VREIKFRAWFKNNNKMWSWESIVKQKWSVDYLSGAISHSAIIMQYTGLKDNNGKEIYEGDIVNYVNKEYVKSLGFLEQSEVFWDGSATGYYILWGKKEYGSSKDEYTHYLLGNGIGAIDDGVKIIGNIYENPELLKKGVAHENNRL